MSTFCHTQRSPLADGQTTTRTTDEKETMEEGREEKKGERGKKKKKGEVRGNRGWWKKSGRGEGDDTDEEQDRLL